MTLPKHKPLPSWEICSPAPVIPISGSFISQYDYKKQLAFYFRDPQSVWMYDPQEDAWHNLPDPGFPSSYTGLGSCGCASAGLGESYKIAISGNENQIYTDLNIKSDLSNFTVEFGPDNFHLRTIKSNTRGPNSIITFIDDGNYYYTSGTQYILRTPIWLCRMAGVQSSGTMRYYDYATNTWSVFNIDTSVSGMNNINIKSSACMTNPFHYDDMNIIVSGVITSGSSNAISFKNWLSQPDDTVYNLVNNCYVIVNSSGFCQKRLLNYSGVYGSFMPYINTTSPFTIIPNSGDIFYIIDNSNTLLITPQTSFSNYFVTSRGYNLTNYTGWWTSFNFSTTQTEFNCEYSYLFNLTKTNELWSDNYPDRFRDLSGLIYRPGNQSNSESAYNTSTIKSAYNGKNLFQLKYTIDKFYINNLTIKNNITEWDFEKTTSNSLPTPVLLNSNNLYMYHLFSVINNNYSYLHFILENGSHYRLKV